MDGQAVAAVIAIVIVLIALFAFARIFRAGNGDPETSHRFTGTELTTDIVIPLSRDIHRTAFWMPSYIGGKSISAIADTGSPYFIVPKSLPCPKDTPCHPLGEKTRISYGDGTSDDAVFTLTHTDLGENHFPRLAFGGSETEGTGSASASDAILGLAPLKAPAGFKQPVGHSVVEQLGAKLLEFDLTDEFNASLRLAPGSKYEKRRGVLVAEAPLVPRGALWTAGVDHATDFYVVKLPQQSPALGALKYLIIDTGTTLTLLPKRVRGDAVIKFPLGEIHVRSEDLGVLPPMYQSPELNAEVGILGNRTMSGLRVIIDTEKGVCRFYRD